MQALQIRLRPREVALLGLMAERERRRPQEQAAALVGAALEQWALDAEPVLPPSDSFDEEVDPWPET